MAKMDIYWCKAIPTLLRELAHQFMDIEEVWYPGMIRNLIATAEGLSDA
jgi:hypothetical protein